MLFLTLKILSLFQGPKNRLRKPVGKPQLDYEESHFTKTKKKKPTTEKATVRRLVILTIYTKIDTAALTLFTLSFYIKKNSKAID